MLVVTAINFLAAIWMFHNMTPELKVERKLFSMDAVKKLVGNGIWNSINSLGVTLNSGLDLLVTNLLLTNLQMGQIAITKTIASIFSSLEAMLCQPCRKRLCCWWRTTSMASSMYLTRTGRSCLLRTVSTSAAPWTMWQAATATWVI